MNIATTTNRTIKQIEDQKSKILTCPVGFCLQAWSWNSFFNRSSTKSILFIYGIWNTILYSFKVIGAHFHKENYEQDHSIKPLHKPKDFYFNQLLKYFHWQVNPGMGCFTGPETKIFTDTTYWATIQCAFIPFRSVMHNSKNTSEQKPSIALNQQKE